MRLSLNSYHSSFMQPVLCITYKTWLWLRGKLQGRHCKSMMVQSNFRLGTVRNYKITLCFIAIKQLEALSFQKTELNSNHIEILPLMPNAHIF